MKQVNTAQIFGPPQLLDGEDAKAYEELLSRFSTAVQPSDFLEEILVRDVVDIAWHVLRLRRLLVNLMRGTAHKGMNETLAPIVGPSRAKELAEAWATRRPDAIAAIGEALDSAGFGIDVVMAQTYSLKLGDLERIDRLIANAEARRNATLREIDRHRDTLGQKLRRVVEQLEIPAIVGPPIQDKAGE
jgi:hypothetical protein